MAEDLKWQPNHIPTFNTTRVWIRNHLTAPPTWRRGPYSGAPSRPSIWGIPAVNYDLMYQSHVRDAKGAINQIVYWSRIPNWKNQTLTPNPDTIYLMPFFSTKDVGPMVLEIPPADEGSITGTIMDCWQAALEDVGPAGVDKGKGGKYLILPPGLQGQGSRRLSSHLPSHDLSGLALLRSILKSRSEADIAKAVAYGKRIKLYPLSQAANPPQTTFVDAVDVVFDGVIPYDVRFFESLDRMVQAEPWLERDRAMIDSLKSLGIEKGKPFNPDREDRRTFSHPPAQEARPGSIARYETGYAPLRRSGTRWFLPADESCVEGRRGRLHARPTSIRPTRAGRSTISPSAASSTWARASTTCSSRRDKDGNPLDGAATYRLHVPPKPPVKQYWSAVLYDFARMR